MYLSHSEGVKFHTENKTEVRHLSIVFSNIIIYDSF